MEELLGDDGDRRQDDELRRAVDNLRDQVYTYRQPDDVYRALAISMGKLARAPICFVAEDLSAETAFRPDESFTVKALSLEGNLVPLDQQSHQPLITGLSILRQVFATRNARVYEANQLLHCTVRLESGPRPIQKMIAIPLRDARKVYGALVLANSARAYNLGLVRRYWPMLSSAVAILRLLNENRTVSSDNLVLSKLESDWHDTLGEIEVLCPTGIIRVDAEQRIVRMNAAAEKIFRIHTENAYGRPLKDLIPERFEREHQSRLFSSASVARGHNSQLVMMGLRTDGESVMLEPAVIPVRENGVEHYLVFLKDLSEQDVARAEIEEQAQKFKVVADLAPIGIVQADKQWEAQYVNNRWCEITGKSFADTMGLGWITMLFGGDAESQLSDMHRSISSGRQFSYMAELETNGGDEVVAEFLARPMFEPNGLVSGFIGTLTDRTYQHEAESKLRKMAERDSLTGLANRSVFMDRLGHALERVERHGAVALLCLDLDGFKNVNDTLGHDAGDELLIEVAKRLKNCVRDEDTVARVGGDEFLVLVEGLYDASVAAGIAEKILKRLEMPANIQHQEMFVTTSIGIAFATHTQHADARNLLKQADIALYRAKNEGRNNYQYYSPELEVRSRDRLELGNSLHGALNRSEFELYYQMQQNLQTGEIDGLEALLRWRHPSKGVIGPDIFIEILEETGIIVPVTRWILHQALGDLKTLVSEGLLSERAFVSVNFTPRLIRDPYMIVGVHGALRDQQLSGSSLKIELTESSLLSDSKNVREFLAAMQEEDVNIALDDFGTGYSSLTYLKKFPIDEIKIDKSFILDLLDDPEDRSITKAVLALAESLNKTCVAEGVESQAVLEMLKEWGCSRFQGFYLNKPLPLQDLRRLLKDKKTASEPGIQNNE